MSKKYTIPEEEPRMVSEPAVAYAIPSSSVHIDVTVEDSTLVSDIKKMLLMIKGIAAVKVLSDKPTRMTGIDKGLDDIRKGNVFHAKDSADLVNQIFG